MAEFFIAVAALGSLGLLALLWLVVFVFVRDLWRGDF